MSWMDSWSRPTKHAAIPPPFYLLPPGQRREAQLYCHTCGRLITSRKTQSHTSPVKYCSSRCRNTKPGPVDGYIENAFVALLNGDQVLPLQSVNPSEPTVLHLLNSETNPPHTRRRKGESRVIVSCDAVEKAVFGPRNDAEKRFGRKKNRARRGITESAIWTSVDMEDKPSTRTEHTRRTGSDNSSDNGTDDDGHDYENDTIEVDKDYIYFGGGKIRAAQTLAEVNGSVGGEKGWAERIDETPEMLEKRAAGQRRAEEREMVRRAARRGCAFGFVRANDEERDETNEEESIGRKKKSKKGKNAKAPDEVAMLVIDGKRMRKCEAIMNGQAVEPSFAKGDWGVRWREDTTA
ncbi:MAG: hypothetical protein MMC33_009097 [Icmadophila ericetorum]|nr:hypothetical protein [Icmadophila ericetorum]